MWKYDGTIGIYEFDSSEVDIVKTVLLEWGYKPQVWDAVAEDSEGELPLDATEPRLGPELSSTDNMMAVSTDGNGLPDDE